MHTLPLRAGLSVALTLLGGLAHAAPVPALDKDPAGFLRFLETSPSPKTAAARREIADGPAALARERIAAQKEGIVVFPAQLNRPLPLEGQNAAPLYLKAEALRRGRLRLPNYAETLSARYAYTPEQLDRIQKIIADNASVFALLHEAADKPQCVFARDWAKDALTAPFTHYAGMRESARELTTESVLLAERGHLVEAVANQTRVYRLAEQTASDRTLISYLVAQALDAIATSGMQSILTLGGPDAAVDAQVQVAVTDQAAHLSLRRALSGDAAIADAGFALLRRGDPSDLNSLINGTDAASPQAKKASTPADRQFFAKLIDAAEASYLHRMRVIIPAADTSDATAFTQVVREASSPTDDLVQKFANLLWPLQYDTLNALPLQSAAARALTRAAATALAERSKTGAYPEVLPGTFTDPYTHRPLGYRRERTDGFVVYSAGPDGKYEGGTPGDNAPFPTARHRFRYPTVVVPVPKREE